MMQAITFKYRNHRGEIQDRTIIPDAVEFIWRHNSKYHNQPGWYISGFDVDKNARRSFPLTSIVLPELPEETRMFNKLFLRD